MFINYHFRGSCYSRLAGTPILPGLGFCFVRVPEPATRTTLTNWLNKHQGIQQQWAIDSLPVSSDVIESLFGSFKHIMSRNPQADMNRSVLLIPALCGSGPLDETRITTLLANTPHKQL